MKAKASVRVPLLLLLLTVASCGSQSVSTYEEVAAALHARDLPAARERSGELDVQAGLVRAIHDQDVEMIDFLLDQGADPNQNAVAFDIDGEVMATDVVTGWEGEVHILGLDEQNGKKTVLVDYVDAPAEVLLNGQFKYRYRVKRVPGPPPLHYAVQVQSPEVIKVLVERGADLTTPYARRSAGHVGMPTDRNSMYQMVEAGVNVHSSYSIAGVPWVLTSHDGLVEANTPPYPAVMTTASEEARKLGIDISELAAISRQGGI